jgi:hypothetical protein
VYNEVEINWYEANWRNAEAFSIKRKSFIPEFLYTYEGIRVLQKKSPYTFLFSDWQMIAEKT